MENNRPTKKARIGRSPLVHRLICSDKSTHDHRKDLYPDVVTLLFEVNRMMTELGAKTLECSNNKTHLSQERMVNNNNNNITTNNNSNITTKVNKSQRRGIKRKCEDEGGDTENERPAQNRKLKKAKRRNFTFRREDEMDWEDIKT